MIEASAPRRKPGRPTMTGAISMPRSRSISRGVSSPGRCRGSSLQSPQSWMDDPALVLPCHFPANRDGFPCRPHRRFNT